MPPNDVFSEDLDLDQDDNDDLQDSLPSEQKTTEKTSKDVTIVNADEIPLFADADKRATKVGKWLEITRINPPNNGYQGKIPKNSTLETIANLFGNGIYNIDLVNGKGQVTHSKEGVKINIPNYQSDNTDNAKKSPLQSDSATSRAISSLHISNKESQERVERLALKTAEDATKLAEKHTELVMTSSREAALRDREFMTSTNNQMQTFFANMFQMQQAAHNQSLEAQRISHEQTMQILLATQSNKQDPMQALLVGIKLATELGNGESEPEWLKAISKGTEGLGHLAALALRSNNPTNVPTQQTSKPVSKNPTKKKAPISKGELLEVIKLKKVLLAKGIDFEQMVLDTRKAAEEGSLRTPNDGGDEDNSSDDSENDAESTEEESSETEL